MKKYDPNIHHRKSIRLKGYDYSKAGLYYLTICVKNRACLYGDVIGGEMNLNHAGMMVENQWLLLPKRFNNIKLHEYIVMPNHFHAILEIVPVEATVGATLVVAPISPNDNTVAPISPNENVVFDQERATTRVAPTPMGKTVGDIVGAFQSITTVEYIRGVKTKNWKPFDGKLWQRNYWDQIIWNEKSFQNISKYIFNNPSKWEKDKFK